VGPIAHSEGSDDVGLGDEFVPRLAGVVDDVVVGLEDAVGKPVLAQVLPDVFDWVELRRARRQPDRRDADRHFQFRSGVPSGAVEDQDGVGARRDVGGDLVEVELHHVGVGVGKRESGALSLGGADRAKQIGVFVALVGGPPETRPAPRPSPHEAVLLAAARLVFEPTLDGRPFRQRRKIDPQDRREVFLNASITRGVEALHAGGRCRTVRGRIRMRAFGKAFPAP